LELKKLLKKNTKKGLKMDKKRRAICNVHFEIDDLIHDIRQLKPILSYDTLKDYETKLNEILVKMKILVIEATEAGQAMEDRLKEYRLAIEDLGFARDKDNKLKDEIANLKQRLFELENLPRE
jgi:hypothetical protein